MRTRRTDCWTRCPSGRSTRAQSSGTRPTSCVGIRPLVRVCRPKPESERECWLARESNIRDKLPHPTPSGSKPGVVQGIHPAHRSTAAFGTSFRSPRTTRLAAGRSQERMCNRRLLPRLKTSSCRSQMMSGKRSLSALVVRPSSLRLITWRPALATVLVGNARSTGGRCFHDCGRNATLVSLRPCAHRSVGRNALQNLATTDASLER